MTEQKCCEKCGRRLTGIENRCYEVDCLECWKREMKEE